MVFQWPGDNVSLRQWRGKLCKACSLAYVGWYAGMPCLGHPQPTMGIPCYAQSYASYPGIPAYWQHLLVCPRYVFPLPGFQSWRALVCHGMSLFNSSNTICWTMSWGHSWRVMVRLWMSLSDWRYALLNGLACDGMSETVVVSNVCGYLLPQPVCQCSTIPYFECGGSTQS